MGFWRRRGYTLCALQYADPSPEACAWTGINDQPTNQLTACSLQLLAHGWEACACKFVGCGGWKLTSLQYIFFMFGRWLAKPSPQAMPNHCSPLAGTTIFKDSSPEAGQWADEIDFIPITLSLVACSKQICCPYQYIYAHMRYKLITFYIRMHASMHDANLL